MKMFFEVVIYLEPGHLLENRPEVVEHQLARGIAEDVGMSCAVEYKKTEKTL